MANLDDLASVAVAARESVVAAPTRLDVVDVRGADAASYLQGQLSQNVEQMGDGETRWSLLLQPQGKVDAWMRVHRLGDRFLLVLDEGYGPAAQARLERFKLRVDVEMETSTRPTLALRGPGSQALAGVLQPADDPGFAVAVEANWGGQGVDLIVVEDGEIPRDLPTEVVSTSADGLDMIRMLRGQPAMGKELDESTIPAAAGVVGPSVDFTKGCYVGQELVARVDSRGNNTPTSLVRLSVAAAANELSADEQLVVDDTVVGRVTSLAASDRPGHSVGLGYVKRGTDVPGDAMVRLADGRLAAVALITLAELG